MHDVLQFHPDVYILVLTELSVSRGWDSHSIYLVQCGIDLRYDFVREFVNRANARETDDEPTLGAKFAPFRMPIIRQAILTLKASAEQHGAQFLVVLSPTVEDADIAQRRLKGIPELLSSMHIAFIDLSDTFTQIIDRHSLRLSRAKVHPNPRAHMMICDRL